jgi:hypothetical protein
MADLEVMTKSHRASFMFMAQQENAEKNHNLGTTNKCLKMQQNSNVRE